MTIIALQGEWETKKVWLNGKRLYPGKSQKVWNHSPDGFSWGYSGSGPAQLALAVLLEHLPQEEARELHQAFKRDVIASLPQADVAVSINLDQWIQRHREEARLQP